MTQEQELAWNCWGRFEGQPRNSNQPDQGVGGDSDLTWNLSGAPTPTPSGCGITREYYKGCGSDSEATGGATVLAGPRTSCGSDTDFKLLCCKSNRPWGRQLNGGTATTPLAAAPRKTPLQH
jgi:hypothetical protein